jgi:hypothetical protein
VGKRRGHKASGGSRKRASGTCARPRRGFDPSPERIAADVARELARHARRGISEVEGSLDAELFASWLVSMWKLGPAALIDADPEAEIGVRVVAAVERAGDARALAVLRAMEVVGSEQVASASAAAAARLAEAGVAEPEWCGGLGAAQARRALIMRDAVFDDAINVLVEFERPAHEPYLIGVLIDHNLGGIAKDFLVGPNLGEIEDSLASAPTEVAGTGELRLEDVELAEAAARSREALWRTECTLDPRSATTSTPRPPRSPPTCARFRTRAKSMSPRRSATPSARPCSTGSSPHRKLRHFALATSWLTLR